MMVGRLAERNLLFGMLALQTGLIDQDVLLRVFRAWTRDKSQSLAALLVDCGDLDLADREAVEALVERHLSRHEGDVEKSLGCLSTTEATWRKLVECEEDDAYPSTEIFVSDRSQDPDPDRTTSNDPEHAEPQGARYRIVRPHARGGLGAVFVALDTELNREVALKRMLDQHADDPQSRYRFLLEAEITGKLEHPGIVPVYGLGRYASGRPFYAMQFIRGDSFKDAIRKFHENPSLKHDSGARSLELRKLLRRFQDACNAIQYAHSRGVLHRDIKPSNIVLGKHGETLVVDWGLAKPTGVADRESGEVTLIPAASGGSSETQPGSALGTPPFMSPEQAEGELHRLGPQSDVYSLGATLYSLICGTLAYPGDDMIDVIRAVRTGKFTPPRQIDPSIEQPLEAICLTAMAHQPEARYATPKALADDIERWMADEPVSVCPEPRIRRLARWIRRHAAIVTGTGAILTSAVVALGLISWLTVIQNNRLESTRKDLALSNIQIKEERDQVEQARKEAARRKVDAETGSKMARKAVKEMLGDVSQADLLAVPQAEPLRIQLAERAVAFYREFDKLKPDDPETRYELARLEEQVASLYRMTGKYDRADQEYAVAVRTLHELIERNPTTPKYMSRLAYTESQIGEMIRLRGGTLKEAEPHYREAVRLAAQLHQEYPATIDYESLVARTHNDLAYLLNFYGRPDDAEPLAREGVACARRFHISLTKTPEPKRFDLQLTILPLILGTHGAILAKQGRQAEAESTLRETIDIFQSQLRQHPDHNDLQYLLSDSLRELAATLASQPGRRNEALSLLNDAIRGAEPLVSRFPSTVFYARYVAQLHAERGAVRLDAGKLDEAHEDLEVARRSLTERLEKEKNAVEPLEYLGKVKHAMARLAVERGKIAEALTLLGEAIELQQRALAVDPANLSEQEQLKKYQALQKQLNEQARSR